MNQARIDGEFKFEGGSTFGFGVETRAMETHQRASGSNLTMGDWGVGDTGNVPDMVALLTPFSLTGAFDDFNPVGAPTGGWKGNANVLGQWALDHGKSTDGSSARMVSCAITRASNQQSGARRYASVYHSSREVRRWLHARELVVGARYEGRRSSRPRHPRSDGAALKTKRLPGRASTTAPIVCSATTPPGAEPRLRSHHES